MDLLLIYQHILLHFLFFTNRKSNLACCLMAKRSLSIFSKRMTPLNSEVYCLDLVSFSKFLWLGLILVNHQQSALVDHFLWCHYSYELVFYQEKKSKDPFRFSEITSFAVLSVQICLSSHDYDYFFHICISKQIYGIFYILVLLFLQSKQQAIFFY